MELTHTLTLEFDGAHIRCSTNYPQLFREISDAYAPMLVDRADSVIADFDLTKSSGGVLVRGPAGETMQTSIDSVFVWLKPRVLNEFMNNRPDLLWIHAGVVEANDKATLLVGPSGSGKSTLSTLLAKKGWTYVSDDVAPLTQEGIVVPYPQSPHRRISGGVLFDNIWDIETLQRERWDPPTDAIRRRRCAVERVVLLKYSFSHGASLTEVGAGQAAVEMMRNSLNFPQHRDTGVERIVSLSRGVHCYLLEYGNAEEAAKLLHALGPEISRLP